MTEEYNKFNDEFKKKWTDTGYISTSMLSDSLFRGDNHSKKTAMNLTEEGISDYFDLYKGEIDIR